jgi:hypothetical protein
MRGRNCGWVERNYIQNVLTNLGLHVCQFKQPFSPIIGSTNLLFKRSLLDFMESSSEAKLIMGGKGLPISVVSTIRFNISKISLILGRDLACRTKHLLATAANFWADLREYFPSSLGSKISSNFLRLDRCGLTHSNSFCSLLGRFLSRGRLPVMSS